MPRSSSRSPQLALRLLDAQVAYHLARLDDDRLGPTVARLAEDLLAAGSQHQIEDLVDRETVTVIAVRALATVPPSAAASGLVELVTNVAYDGPATPYPVGELADGAQVEALLDSLLALQPAFGRFLEGLADVPLVGTVASRFMGRVVSDVLAANKVVTDRVPGLGSLISFGNTAASRMVGAADKQFDGLVGDTLGRGGAFAVRRLNRIVLETLRDPTTRDSVLQAWDAIAQEQVVGLHHYATREELGDVADALHDLAITALATEQAAALVGVVVDALFDRFGGYTPTELLDQLDITREDLVADLVRTAPPVVGALRDSGDLERLLRRQLEPFFTSAEVEDLLG